MKGKRPKKRAQGAPPATAAATRGSIGLVGGGNYANGQLVKRSVDDFIEQRFGSNMTPLCLCPVKQGAGFNERVGEQILLKTIHIKGHIATDWLTNDSPTVPTHLRLMLVYDRESNGGTPTISDILLDVDEDGTGTSGVFAGLNLRERKRFHIFRDKRLYYCGPDPTYQSTVNRAVITGEIAAQGTEVDWYVKLNDLNQDYKAATAEKGSISAGTLWLIAIGNQTLTNARAVFQGSARLRFTLPGPQY